MNLPTCTRRLDHTKIWPVLFKPTWGDVMMNLVHTFTGVTKVYPPNYHDLTTIAEFLTLLLRYCTCKAFIAYTRDGGDMTTFFNHYEINEWPHTIASFERFVNDRQWLQKTLDYPEAFLDRGYASFEIYLSGLHLVVDFDDSDGHDGHAGHAEAGGIWGDYDKCDTFKVVFTRYEGSYTVAMLGGDSDPSILMSPD